MTEVHNFGTEAVTCHAWNKNCTELALSSNSTEVKVYKKTGGGWQEYETMTEHGQKVTSIDWAPNSNRIVTCGSDRNAYVWNYNNGKWTPILVILRFNRSATVVKWSPNENKFAVGSGARLISVCYFEEENNWWVSKHIKKPIRSTITCLDWHPNNAMLACGSTDFKARIFSGFVKDVESKPSGSPWWDGKMSFGTLIAEYSNGGGGWVHDVSFSPKGDKLAWIGHDSSISVVNANNGQKVAVIKEKFLPFISCTWVSEENIVAAGFDCCPLMFNYASNGNLRYVCNLDVPKEQSLGTQSAMQRFRDLDRMASGPDDSSKSMKTLHQNAITQVVVHTGTKENCSKFSTSGIDGNLIIWDVKSLEKSLADMKIS